MADGPERSLLFHFAGRPVAQLDLAAGIETWKYLTTDHLGTPIAATSANGALLWQGGFEPFGSDWNGAGAAGVFLRFPGQWEEEAWTNAGAGVLYNLHRWYETTTGRYTGPDPLGLPDPIDFDESHFNLYEYAVQNPVVNIDPTGLITIPWNAPDRCRRRWERKLLPRLRQPSDNCKNYFCQKLNTDLDGLLGGPFPMVIVGGGRGGSFGCHTANSLNVEPEAIKVGKSSFCGSTREALHVVLHELGHFADCWNNGDKFKNEEDGCGAEVACFGFSIGKNCKDRGYPTR